MEYVKLRDVIIEKISGEWGTEGTADNGVKVLRTTNFTNIGKIDYTEIVYRIIPANKIEKKRILYGDIIIEKSGGSPNQPVGRVVFFDKKDGSVYITNNFTAILRPDPQFVYNKFLFYSLFFLHKKGITLKYQNKTTGILNIRLDKYLEEKILVPSLTDQVRIAKLLSRVEELIEDRKKSINLLDDLLKSKFYDMFGNPVKNEKAWEEKILSDLGTLDRGVSKHRPRNAPELLGGIYPLIQTGDVANSGLYIESYKQTYSKLVVAQSKLWDKGTLLITIAANIAKTGILKIDACFPDSIVGFIPNHKKTNSIYIHFVFQFFQQILEKNAPQAAQKNINLSILRNLNIPVPSIEMQNQFAEIAQKVEALKKDYKESLSKLENLYGSLSQRVFKGELDLSRLDITEELDKFNATLPSQNTSIIAKLPKSQQKDKKEKGEEDENLRTSITYETFGSSTESFFNSERIADLIIKRYKGYHFSFEMVYHFLKKQINNIDSYYFASEDLLKDPKLSGEQDLKKFFYSAINGENPFIKLKQSFYNSKDENFNLKLTKEDYEHLQNTNKNDRSGIYFSIEKL